MAEMNWGFSADLDLSVEQVDQGDGQVALIINDLAEKQGGQGFVNVDSASHARWLGERLISWADKEDRVAGMGSFGRAVVELHESGELSTGELKGVRDPDFLKAAAYSMQFLIVEKRVIPGKKEDRDFEFEMRLTAAQGPNAAAAYATESLRNERGPGWYPHAIWDVQAREPLDARITLDVKDAPPA
jgi:hypothetical protein